MVKMKNGDKQSKMVKKWSKTIILKITNQNGPKKMGKNGQQ